MKTHIYSHESKSSPLPKKEGFSITTAHIKIIALIAMTIDHIAKAFPFSENALWPAAFIAIGRISFPIFAFLLATGWEKTSSRKRYFLRVLACAFVSQVPYQIALYPEDKVLHLNVLFTFAIAMGYIHVIPKITKGSDSAGTYLAFFVLTLATFALHKAIDFGVLGIALPVLLYLLPKDRGIKLAVIIAWAIAFYGITPAGIVYTSAAAAAGLAIYACSDNQGTRSKYFKALFYIYYPLHLIILALISEAASRL